MSLERRNTKKLFEAVVKGQTGNTEKFLDHRADVNGVDEEGRTPLIRAAQMRNYVVQNLLLSKGASVNRADKVRRTALHYEAAHGDVESIKLLLANGALINCKDAEGRTPLLFAVNRNHTEVVDILVFCGADGMVRDKDGHSPSSVCTNSAVSDLMTQSKEIVHGIKHNYIHVKQTVLRPGKTETMKHLGLVIEIPADFSKTGVGFLCRRVRPECNKTPLGPGDKELLISDTFEYRISGFQSEGEVKVWIPIYSKPEIFEEVFIKTNRTPVVTERNSSPLEVIAPETENDVWMCTAMLELKKVSAFVLVTRPKVEHFRVTSKGGEFTSSVVENMELLVPKDTFSDKGDVTLEVLPKPIYKEEEFEHVLSMSDFYDIRQTEDEQPENDVIITLPVPDEYDGSGDLYILARRDDDAFENEEDNWKIIARNPKVSQKTIQFGASHFSDYVEFQFARESVKMVDNSKQAMKESETGSSGKKLENDLNILKKGGFPKSEKHETDSEDKKEPEKKQTLHDIPSERKIKIMCANLYEKAKKRECIVSFVAMLKPKVDSAYEVLVECIQRGKVTQRIEYWRMDGFKDQKPSYPVPNEFVAYPGKEFLFDIGGNAKKVKPVQTTLLYIRHRHNGNNLTFDITPPRTDQDDKGWINISKAESDDSQARKWDRIARVLLHLYGEPTNENSFLATEERINDAIGDGKRNNAFYHKTVEFFEQPNSQKNIQEKEKQQLELRLGSGKTTPKPPKSITFKSDQMFAPKHQSSNTRTETEKHAQDNDDELATSKESPSLKNHQKNVPETTTAGSSPRTTSRKSSISKTQQDIVSEEATLSKQSNSGQKKPTANRKENVFIKSGMYKNHQQDAVRQPAPYGGQQKNVPKSLVRSERSQQSTPGQEGPVANQEDNVSIKSEMSESHQQRISRQSARKSVQHDNVSEKSARSVKGQQSCSLCRIS